MKTRAAVAFEKTKPLTVTDVELDGPKAGEVLVEVKATGICHTDDFALRRRSGRSVPSHSGPRGRRHRCRCRAGCGKREERGPRHSALYAGVPAMPVLSVA